MPFSLAFLRRVSVHLEISRQFEERIENRVALTEHCIVHTVPCTMRTRVIVTAALDRENRQREECLLPPLYNMSKQDGAEHQAGGVFHEGKPCFSFS
jgi:hypothetical protein